MCIKFSALSTTFLYVLVNRRCDTQEGRWWGTKVMGTTCRLNLKRIVDCCDYFQNIIMQVA